MRFQKDLRGKEKGTWKSCPSEFNYKTLTVMQDLLNRDMSFLSVWREENSSGEL